MVRQRERPSGRPTWTVVAKCACSVSSCGAVEKYPILYGPLARMDAAAAHTARFRYTSAMPIVDDIAGLRRILMQTRTIAVVGLSANWYRPSYFAAKYMQDHGYRIVPVNPTYTEVLGERCYPSLGDIPHAVDMVDCFRKAEEMVPLARDAVA